MANLEAVSQNRKKGVLELFIKSIEWVGNLLPHPFILFLFFAVVVLVCSSIYEGTSVTYTAAARNVGEAAKETTVAVQNLMTAAYWKTFLPKVTSTYMGFLPLGLICVMMLGISVMEESGFISAFMRKSLLGAPSYMITLALTILGINANLASDAGIIFTITIGAVIYHALGRNPWMGVIVGFAAVLGGYTANFFLTSTDVLLVGVSSSVTQEVGIPFQATLVMNWYFMAAATIVLAIIIVWVAEKFLVKLLDGEMAEEAKEDSLISRAITDEENRGLKWALAGLILYFAVFLWNTVPSDAFFRNDEGNFLPTSPLFSSLIVLIMLFFLTIGTFYGIGAGVVHCMSDVPKLMHKGMKGVLPLLLTAFPASIFLAFFSASNLAPVLAVKGAAIIKESQMGVIPLVLLFVVMTGFINLFIGSAITKWIIMGPIFLPMFAMLNLSPALTQAAFRIGDSVTGIISPTSSSLVVVIGLLEQYNPYKDRKVGMGTVIALEMPFAVCMFVGFCALLVLWIWLNLPLGPGASIFIR
jgi:aminobenzoyl-glutamate transport protein